MVFTIKVEGGADMKEMVMARTVMVAEFDFVGSVTEVAVRVTARSLNGGVAGAV